MASVLNRGTRDQPRWYAKIKGHDGRWKMVTTKQRTKAQALRWALEKEAALANTQVGIEEPARELTFEEAADHWLTNHSEAACVSHDDNVGRMKHLRKAFGPMLLSEITAKRVDEFTAARKRETASGPGGKRVARWAVGTINRMLSLLRKVLNDSVTWQFLKAAPKVKLLPEPEASFDFLQRDEAERLLAWTHVNAPREFPLYATAIYTGARMGELYGLLWADVDLDRAMITIRRSYEQPFTKSKKIRRVRINQQLCAILLDWQKSLRIERKSAERGSGEAPSPRETLVFPANDGDIRPRERPPRGFGEHLSGAGCHAITFHDLRHTAASLMVMSGMHLRTVQQMLGHSTIQVTERYADLAPDFMAGDVDRLSLDTQSRWGQVREIDASA